jgi:hypothetical protein
MTVNQEQNEKWRTRVDQKFKTERIFFSMVTMMKIYGP